MQKEYIECSCQTIEHLVRITWEKGSDWPEMYIETYLNDYRGFFKRFWYGIKYILGFKSKYGAFGDTILEEKQIRQLRDLCNKWLYNHGDKKPQLPQKPSPPSIRIIKEGEQPKKETE